MAHATEMFLVNKFDIHGEGCFFDGIVVWFAVWLKATKVVNSCSLFSVFPWDVALGYPYFICSVIDMVRSIYIAHPALPEDHVEP
jgi:hypothetical protein